MVKIIKSKDQAQKKGNIIAALNSLKDNLGWKVILKVLKNDVKSAEARLYGDAPIKKDESIKEWQNIRRDRLQVIELPDTLIKDNEENEEFDPKLDPYD